MEGSTILENNSSSKGNKLLFDILHLLAVTHVWEQSPGIRNTQSGRELCGVLCLPGSSVIQGKLLAARKEAVRYLKDI